jgi:hypothetical protein
LVRFYLEYAREKGDGALSRHGEPDFEVGQRDAGDPDALCEVLLRPTEFRPERRYALPERTLHADIVCPEGC